MDHRSNLCLLLITAMLLTSCVNRGRQKVSIENANSISISDSSLALMNVQLIEPTFQVIKSNINLAGKVTTVPNNRASVISDIEGRVEKIFVFEGTYVKKGTPIMSLRSMALIELQRQYAEAKSQFDFLLLEYTRQKELADNHISALAKFQDIEAKYKASEGRVKALQAKLQLLGFSRSFIDSCKIATHLTIRSPIDGYVFDLPVQVGVVATPETKLAEIVNTDDLIADVYVYDKDLDNVAEGQNVLIDFITHSYPSVRGTIMHIARAIDVQTKAVTAHVKFRAPRGKLILPEMSVQCVVIKKASLEPKMVVPHSAILEEADRSYVYLRFSDSTASAQQLLYKYQVTKGDQNEKWVQVTFSNEPKGNYKIVSKNVMIVENERKKRSGLI